MAVARALGVSILGGTDFSEQGDRACTVAAELARRCGDALLLVHVLEPPTTNVIELATDARRFEKVLHDRAQEKLEKLASELRARGAKIETRLLLGRADQKLASYAQEISARLIVIGNHSQPAPWRWFVGRVAERTVRRADRPVLVVREAQGGLEAWARGERPLQVLVGIDESVASEAALAWVRDLRKVGPCDLLFVHLRAPAFFQADNVGVKNLERELRARIGELPGQGSTSVRIHPSWNPRSETLGLVAADEEVDLVVVGTHHPQGLDRLWNGSLAESILRTPVPAVVCVPAPAKAAEGSVERPIAAPFRSVLAAIDLSDASRAVIPYAYGLVRGPGAGVVLCTVQPMTCPEGERRRLEEELRTLIPEEAEAFGIATQVRVEIAPLPADAITGVARELGVDAICLGVKARGVVAEALHGSVVGRVIHQAKVPVLLVKERHGA